MPAAVPSCSFGGGYLSFFFLRPLHFTWEVYYICLAYGHSALYVLPTYPPGSPCYHTYHPSPTALSPAFLLLSPPFPAAMPCSDSLPVPTTFLDATCLPHVLPIPSPQCPNYSLPVPHHFMLDLFFTTFHTAPLHFSFVCVCPCRLLPSVPYPPLHVCRLHIYYS